MTAMERIGRYRLEDLLASGASAEVWRALDEDLGRAVALKLLHSHLLPDETSRRRLEHEARVAAGLSHPGIVTVYDVIRTDDRPGIVLELVEGESLAAHLAREGRMTASQAARIAADVADALSHAHQHGVVHRDVKPGNILLDQHGRARLSDFGIARLLDDQQRRLTQPGMVAGTLHYLAPEQLAGGEVGPPADVYGLGAVLYEMLAGRPPFAAPTPVALAEAQQRPPTPISDSPTDLSAIALAALEPDPGARLSTAGEMADALRAWLEGAPVPLFANELVDVEQTTVVDSPTVGGGWPSASRRWARHLAMVAVPATVGLLLGALLLGAIFLSPAASPSPPAGAAISTPTPPKPTPRQPTPPASPLPTPPAILAPTPAPDHLAAAYSRFAELVIAGQRDGTISEDATKKLLDGADKVLDKAENGEQGEINKELNELRKTINEHAREGEIEPETATELRQAVDEMAAATRR